MAYDMQKRAKLRCMHLLEKRDYTEKELRQKLTAGKTEYTQEEMDIAIDYVKSFHYVDDGIYACKYIEAMSSRKSRRQIEQELYLKEKQKMYAFLARKGFCPENIQRALKSEFV